MSNLRENLRVWFAFHTPNGEQTRRYELIRKAGQELATLIVDNTPPSADQTAAVRKVREAVMTANAAIACEGKLTEAATAGG